MRWTTGRGVSGLLIAMVLATSAFAQTASDSFTIVVLPDTQMYAKSYPQIFASQTKWIAAQKSAMNIQLVIGLGDIVDSGSQTYQWQNADAAYRTLDEAGVPYVAAIGNHDYDEKNVAGRTAYTKNFNSYFGPSRYAGKPYYGGSYPSGSNENFYGVVTLGVQQYLILVLEVFPRDESLAWAAGVMQANADKPVILVTHAYTYYDNMRMSKCDSNSSYSFGVGADNDGEDIWNKFASKYAKLEMVLSGHVVQGDGTGRRGDVGENGNLVNQMLSDYQSWPSGGNGYLRLITVTPSLNLVEVKTYSPYLNQWLTDANNEFKLAQKFYAPTDVLRPISGKVKSALDCKVLSGVTITLDNTTVTTDSGGNFSITGTAGIPYWTNAKKSGWGSVTKLASAVTGQSSQAKFLMSPSGVLKGKVVNGSGAGVSGAAVTVKGGALKITKELTTDGSGNFNTSWVPVGTYSIAVKAGGYSDATSSATVNTGLTTSVQIMVK